MLVMREMPRADEVSRAEYYRRRIRGGMVVAADAVRAEYPIDPGFRPELGCLSIVAVHGGREEYGFADRTLLVDDDVYLVINADARYRYRLLARRPARSVTVAFPPGMVAEVAAVMDGRVDRLLDRAATDAPGTPPRFAEQLEPHDDRVSPELARIARACRDGVEDPEWYAQQMAVLLVRLFEGQRRRERGIDGLDAVRRSTREELARRVGRATDRIHEAYAEPLDLRTLARAAGLSPFHLLRAFRQVHGVTPQAYLQHKRAAVASRLMRDGHASAGQAARGVGFASRSSLYRWLGRNR